MSIRDEQSEMPRYTRRVLLVHVDKDPVVPVGDSRRAVGIYSDASLKIIPGAGHGFKSDEFGLYTGYIIDFLKGLIRFTRVFYKIFNVCSIKVLYLHIQFNWNEINRLL